MVQLVRFHARFLQYHCTVYLLDIIICWSGLCIWESEAVYYRSSISF